MGFGSGAQGSPLEQEAEETNSETETEQEPESVTEQPTPSESSMDLQTHSPPESVSDQSIETFADVDVTDYYSTAQLAQMLMAEEYRTENPNVPYAMWRDGTSTGRSRTTLELNPEVDDLVTTVRREFEDRYDAEINKADLREFALVYGLMHFNEIFELAEEWGLQYNS